MPAKRFTNKLINRSSINEELKLIDESNTDYIDRHGNVYKDYGDGMMFPKKSYKNSHNGYLYVGITTKEGVNKSRRVHILVGKAFVENPNNFPYVCHKDDNKANPEADNLFWGDASINTKLAFDHGLALNDKGYDDSQSIPVCCFDKNGNFLKDYGSISIAAKQTGLTKAGIIYQCDHKMKTKPRKSMIFRYKDEVDKTGFVL